MLTERRTEKIQQIHVRQKLCLFAYTSLIGEFDENTLLPQKPESVNSLINFSVQKFLMICLLSSDYCWLCCQISTNSQKLLLQLFHIHDNNYSNTLQLMSNHTFNETLNVQSWPECSLIDVHGSDSTCLLANLTQDTLLLLWKGKKKNCCKHLVLA